jgi:hypothetical protein
MARIETNAPTESATARHFLLSNGQQVAYVPAKDESEDPKLSFIGNKLN